MKMDYDPQTDSLYIKLKAGTYLESEEIAPGVVVDFDADGSVLALDVEHASEKFDLNILEIIGLSIPVTVSNQKVKLS